MNNIEALTDLYQKLNTENQIYSLGILQALNFAQDAMVKQQTKTNNEKQSC